VVADVAHSFDWTILIRPHPQKGEKMSGITLEQLDELLRQIEADYKMDMAALERLSRLCSGAAATASAPADIPVSNVAQLGASRVKSVPPAPLPPTSRAPEPQPDELAGSLRAMFANSRKS
jgi:hypothetical protein